MKLEDALQKAGKYKKRCEWLKKKMEMATSPQLKTKQQTKQRTVDLRRTILLQNTIISQIKNKYQNMHTARDRQVMSKVVWSPDNIHIINR